MTEQEQKVLDLSASLWNSFIKLNEQDFVHPDEVNEFRFHIHALQNMILARPEIKKQKR